MRVTVTLTPDDGESLIVTADSRDIFVWERTVKGASLAKLEDDPTMTALYEVTHIASKRQGLDLGTLSEMAERYALAQGDDDDDGGDSSDEDPTRSGRSAGP